MEKVEKFKSWSFSRYNTYTQCPLKARLQYIEKIPQDPSPHLERGIRIHEEAEAYIKGEGDVFNSFGRFIEFFDFLRQVYSEDQSTMVVEDNWSFTREWNETQWNNWKACYLRVKLDCAYHSDEKTLEIIDFKTGKFSPYGINSYREQLQLYALAALILHPHVEVVKPRLVYLDAGVVYPEPESLDEKSLTFTQMDVERLKKLWEQRITPMMEDTIFKPTPNKLCPWCSYRKSNGGPCNYG